MSTPENFTGVTDVIKLFAFPDDFVKQLQLICPTTIQGETGINKTFNSA